MLNSINQTKSKAYDIPIINIPVMTDERWHEIARKQKTKSNNSIISEIMRTWNCSRLEAVAGCKLECESLKDTQESIAQAVTYKRLLINLLPGIIVYLQKKYSGTESEAFILDEAKEMTEEQAYLFAYEWEQFDDYDGMTEAEIKSVVFN